MQDYKKLDVWHKSYRLTLGIYRLTKSYPKDELFGMVSQMRRAAMSVPANISEGCGRRTNADLAHHLDIALGSLSELDCYIQLSRDLSYITPENFATFDRDLVEVRRMLIAFIQRLRE